MRSRFRRGTARCVGEKGEEEEEEEEEGLYLRIETRKERRRRGFICD